MNKYLYWTPRILSILFIAFLTIFSFDVFDSPGSWWQLALGFLIHNIPVLILIAVLVISWKREIVGGIVFILAGFLYIFLAMGRNNFEWYLLSYSLIIAGPAFLIGILFILNWRKKKS